MIHRNFIHPVLGFALIIVSFSWGQARVYDGSELLKAFRGPGSLKRAIHWAQHNALRASRGADT